MQRGLKALPYSEGYMKPLQGLSWTHVPGLLSERSLGQQGGGGRAEDRETGCEPISIPNLSFQVEVSMMPTCWLNWRASLEQLRITQACVQWGQGREALPFSALGQLHNRLAFKLLPHSRHYASGPGKNLPFLILHNISTFWETHPVCD